MAVTSTYDNYYRDYQPLNLKRTTNPATTPVTLSEAKEHLKIDGSYEDDYLTELLVAATGIAEEFTYSSFITQEYRLTRRYWPEGSTIYLPKGPLQSVDSVKYRDENGNQVTVDSSNYTVSTNGDVPAIEPVDSWETTNNDYHDSIEIDYTTGYGSENAVPSQIKHAIKVLLADLHLFRQGYTKQIYKVMGEGQPYWQYLIQPYRIYYPV